MAYIWIWATLCRNVKQKANKIEAAMGQCALGTLFRGAGPEARGGGRPFALLFPYLKQCVHEGSTLNRRGRR